MSREDPSSGDMEAAVDSLYTINDACGMPLVCSGKAEAQHRRCIHSIYDSVVYAAFTSGARLLLSQ